MPLRTIRNENDGTFAFTGTWNSLGASGIPGSTPTSPAASGTVRYSSTAGDVCTITLPANHGFTGGVIIGHGAFTNHASAVIAVDGVTVQNPFNEKFATIGNAAYYLPRLLSLPFVLNPAKGTTQIITITVGAGGGNCIIDGMELFTAAAPVAGRLVRFGMSMEYPVIDGSTLGPNTSGHGQLFAAYLTSIAYLGNTWTDVNQAVPSESMTQGHASSGTAGGPNTAPAYPQFGVITEFYPNTAIFTPGWMRAEAGDLWPTPAPALGAALFTTNAQYMQGVAQAWAQLGQYYLFFHNYNDVGLSALYDNPYDDLPANGASALFTIATATAGGTPAGGTFTITDGTHPAVLSPTATVASMQTTINAAALPVTVTGPAGAALGTGGNVVTFTANTRGVLTLTKSADSVTGGTVTFATTQVGRVKTAAGAGFALARYIQRVREFLIRIALAITPCPTVLLIGYPNNVNGAPMTNGAAQIYDAAMRDLTQEAWIPTVCNGAYPFKFVPIMGAMTGHPSNVSLGDAHPNNYGHLDIFYSLVRAHETMLATSRNPSTSYRG